jgi:hypothetical protein
MKDECLARAGAIVFENIPEKLDRFVRTLGDKFNPGDDQRYLYASLFVALQFYGDDLLKRPDVLNFLKMSSAEDTIGFDAAIRLRILAEMLFALRLSPGFEVLCRRLTTRREMRSTFFELMSAQFLLDGGFTIHARAETGIKGNDFDFYGVRSGKTVNVEVTTLTANNFSVNTALNALKAKRTQLPPDAPAIIFCIVPDAWLYPPSFTKPRFEYVGARFLAGTHRINAVIFWGAMPTQWKNLPSHGSLVFAHLASFNKAPRFPIEDDTFLRGRKVTPEMREGFKGVDAASALQTFRDTEFYRWVDLLAPPKQA